MRTSLLNSKGISNKSKIFTIILSIMPFLNIYGTHLIPALRIGEVVGLLMIGYLVISEKKIRLYEKNRLYWLTLVYLIAISFILTFFIAEYSISNTIVRSIRVSFYTVLALYFARRYYCYEYGKNLYIFYSTIASFFVLVQFLLLQVTGSYFTFIIPGMNLSTNHPTSAGYFAQITRDLAWYGKSTRPSGLFLEPAHYCEFVLFSLIFLLFDKATLKRRVTLIIFNITAIAVSGSAVGYFGMILICAIWLLEQFKNHKLNKNILILSLVGVITAIVVSVEFGLLDKALWRLLTVKSTDSSTGNLRLLRGFVIYNEMPFLYQIFGMGFGNFSEFIEKYNIITFFDATLERTNEFMNSISVVLVSGGFCGIIMYGVSLYEMFKNTNKMQKVFFGMFIILIFTSNNFYKESYMFSLMFMTLSEENTFRKN